MKNRRKTIWNLGTPKNFRSGVGCWATLLALASVSSALDLSSFAGIWIPDSSQVAMIRQAIDSYAANLDAQARPATVDRLTSINPPVTQLEFVFADSMKTIQIGYDGKPGTTVVLGATGIPTNGAQDEILLFKVGTQEGCLVETYYADDGTRTNRYSLSPDGMSMAMEVTVESPYMPASLVYRVGFARKGGTRAIPRKAIAPVSNTCQFPAFANLFPSSLACRLTRNVNGRSSF